MTPHNNIMYARLQVLRQFDAMLSDSLMEEMDAVGVKVIKFSKVV